MGITSGNLSIIYLSCSRIKLMSFLEEYMPPSNTTNICWSSDESKKQSKQLPFIPQLFYFPRLLSFQP